MTIQKIANKWKIINKSFVSQPTNFSDNYEETIKLILLSKI